MMKPQMIITLMMISTFAILLNLMKNNHPILMIINLIIYSLMICMIMSTWTFNFMYSIMMFLMMISGLLIIFLYFSSLISNEQSNLKMNKIIWMNMIINITLMTYLTYMMQTFPPFYSQENSYLPLMNTHAFLNIFKIYNYPFSNLTIMCMIFLLISLIMIIKICSIKSSPLRKIS